MGEEGAKERGVRHGGLLGRAVEVRDYPVLDVFVRGLDDFEPGALVADYLRLREVVLDVVVECGTRGIVGELAIADPDLIPELSAVYERLLEGLV